MLISDDWNLPGSGRWRCRHLATGRSAGRSGALAYNLFVLFKIMALPQSWRVCQVQTVRWRLYLTAGKVVSQAGSVWLKVRRWLFGFLEEVRTRCRELDQG